MSKRAFVPQQVALHNRALDILTMIQECKKRIEKRKKMLREWDTAGKFELVRLMFPNRCELEYNLYWQRQVLARLTNAYIKVLTALIDPEMTVDSVMGTVEQPQLTTAN